MLKRIKSADGITLIALVITIIILLILAGVTISVLVGENGILEQTVHAQKENTKSGEKEILSLAYNGVKTIELNGPVTKEKLQKELDKYTGEGKTNIEDNGDGTFDVEFYDTSNRYTVSLDAVDVASIKITNKKIICNSSSQEILFKNTISQQEVDAIAGRENANYQVLGISSTEDGEYTTTAIGNSGELQIQGEAKNATFKYILTDFMKGNETFFVKYTIDGIEQKKQKLEVIQADALTYEEDFVGFTIEVEGIDELVIEENENFSNGKAIKLECSEIFPKAKIAFEFTGSEMEFRTIVKKQDQGMAAFFIDDLEGNRVISMPQVFDTTEEVEYNVGFPHYNIGTNGTWLANIETSPLYNFDNWDYNSGVLPPIVTTYLYFDAIVIYK